MSDPHAPELEEIPDPDDADEVLENVSDEDWRRHHEHLRELGIPAHELAYVWAPGVSVEELQRRGEL